MSKFMPFDFRCESCGFKFEEWVKPDKHVAPCPECSAISIRLASTARFPIAMGVDTSMPTMADKWAKMHEQGRKADEKRAEDHGPDSWGSDGADVRR
jgi:putative FmdB family regulatory protein